MTKLSTDIATINTKTGALSVDMAAAFQRLKDETNLSNGVLLAGGIVPGIAGNIVDIPITLIPGTFLPTGLQADILIPSGFTFVSMTAGPIVAAGQKQIQMAPGGGFERFIVFGINQIVMVQGILATIRFSIAPTTSKRQYPIILSNPVVSDASGTAIVVSTISGTVIL